MSRTGASEAGRSCLPKDLAMRELFALDGMRAIRPAIHRPVSADGHEPTVGQRMEFAGAAGRCVATGSLQSMCGSCLLGAALIELTVAIETIAAISSAPGVRVSHGRGCRGALGRERIASQLPTECSSCRSRRRCDASPTRSATSRLARTGSWLIEFAGCTVTSIGAEWP